jgi:MFS family permease
MMGGMLLWGLHLGITQGVLSALVGRTAPTHLRGTAFGLFNLVSGVSMLIASLLAGFVWDLYGAAATFLLGLVFCLISLFLMLLSSRVRAPAE